MTWDPVAAIAAELEAREWTAQDFATAMAAEYGVSVGAALRRWYSARTGEYRTGPEWMDRMLLVLDLHEPVREDVVPGLDAYCPACREVGPSDQDGGCVWCGAQTGGNTRLLPRPPQRANAGVPMMMDEDVIAEARRLYLTGLGLRRLATALIGRTRYASVRSLEVALHKTFAARGWAMRDRALARAASGYKHGHATKYQTPEERRAYRRWQRRVRGMRPACVAVKTGAPGKGKPCRLPAAAGSRYCSSHDPARAEARRAHLDAMRVKAAMREAA